MFKLKIENRFGDTLSLTDNKNYIVKEIDGLDPPKSKINVSNVAGMPGGIYNSSKVETRNIVITVKPRDPVEKNRLKLYKYVQSGQWCKVYYSNGSLDVMIEGYVENVEAGLFSKSEEVQISIICPQPYFEALHEIYNDISSLIPAFTFPFSIETTDPVHFSYINHEVLATVCNVGDEKTGVLIYITARGEVVDPVIYFSNTRGSIGLNFTLQEHDQVIIDTNEGNRSVKLLRGTEEINLMNKVKKNPEWFVLMPGENIFSYDAESGVDLMGIIFRHRTKYGGV